jgi:hypothetical protein
VELAARLSLALSTAGASLVVLLLARVRQPGRVLLVDLGRAPTAADRARARRVAAVAGASAVLGTVLALVVPGPPLAVSLLPLVPVLWLLGETVALVRTLPRAEATGRYAVPLEPHPPATAFVSAPLQAANVAVVLLAPAIFLALRSRLPDRVPMQVGLDGTPSRYGSPDELWGVFALMALLFGLLWVIVGAIARERRVLPPGAPERYAALERRRRTGLCRIAEASMLVANATMAGVALSLAAGSLPGGAALRSWGPVAATALSLIGLGAVLAVWIPRLARLHAEQRALGGTPALGTRAGGWRLGGVVYFAPEDPAVFVPKRLGIGLTLNFARPAAWLFLAAAVLLPLLVAGLATTLAR